MSTPTDTDTADLASPYRVVLQNDIDPEEYVAEIWHASGLWAVVSYDRQSESFDLEVRNSNHSDRVVVPLAWVLTALREAERRLRLRGYGADQRRAGTSATPQRNRSSRESPGT